jgi:hypothetical protein
MGLTRRRYNTDCALMTHRHNDVFFVLFELLLSGKVYARRKQNVRAIPDVLTVYATTATQAVDM